MTPDPTPVHEKVSHAVGCIAPDLDHRGACTMADHRTAEEAENPAPTLGCFDCGMEYGGTGWCDVVIPTEDWCAISPTGNQGGILCFGCIARRLSRAGRTDVPMMVTSGPFERDPRDDDGTWLDTCERRSEAPPNGSTGPVS